MFGQEYSAHSATAQLPQQAKIAELGGALETLASRRSCVRQQGILEKSVLEKSVQRVVAGQERVRPGQGLRIVRALLREECGALFGLQLERPQQDIVDSAFAIEVVHCSRSFSHNRATRQKRSTVDTETSSTSAVSSIVKPPK